MVSVDEMEENDSVLSRVDVATQVGKHDVKFIFEGIIRPKSLTTVDVYGTLDKRQNLGTVKRTLVLKVTATLSHN